MGLTIYYSGEFSPRSNLQDMIEEVLEIAQTHQWKFHVFENRFPDSPKNLTAREQKENRYGLMVIIPHAEPLHLHFNVNRNLGFKIDRPGVENMNKNKEHESGLANDKNHVKYGAATKTQFAGVETHIKIVQLLKYVASKFLINVNVLDKGNYWETGDANQLREIFNQYKKVFDYSHSTLTENCKEPNESSEEYLKRRLHERKS